MDAASVAAEPKHYISQTNQVAAGRGMTLDERAVMLASAVSIDFDYFSRHSSVGHHGFIPIGSDHNSSVGSSGSTGSGVAPVVMAESMRGDSSGGQQQPDGQPPPQGQYDPYQPPEHGGYPYLPQDGGPPNQLPQDGGYPYQQQVDPENPFAHQDPWGRDPPQQYPADTPQGGGGGDGWSWVFGD